MSTRPVLEPSTDHPITVEPTGRHVTVTAAGRTLVETDAALTLREGDYPPVLYLPLADADAELLERSDHNTYCPYKGEASYFNVPALGADGENAVWQYRDPHPAMAAIKDRIAFYPDRVEITEG